MLYSIRALKELQQELEFIRGGVYVGVTIRKGTNDV